MSTHLKEGKEGNHGNKIKNVLEFVVVFVFSLNTFFFIDLFIDF